MRTKLLGLCGLLIFLLSALPGCGGGGGVGGGGDEPPKNALITTVRQRVSTQTFPNGAFPKGIAKVDNQVWVANEYTKLIIAQTDLDTLADRDRDFLPDICEILKGFDADNIAIPNAEVSESKAIADCGDLTFSRVTALQADTLAVLGQVEVPREANYIAATSDSIYVTHFRDGYLTKIDRATRKVVTAKRIGTAGTVGEIIADPANDRLFIMDTTIAENTPRASTFLLEVRNVSAVGLNGTFTVAKLELPPTQNLTRRAPGLVYFPEENKVYIPAFDQKRIYQVDTSVTPPVFASFEAQIRGNRNEILEGTDPAIMSFSAAVLPMLSASALTFKDKVINANLVFESTDSNGTKTIKAHFPFTIDTNGDTTDDTTYHAVLDLYKGELGFYEFVTISGGRVTTEDKNKIRDPIRYKGERLVARDYGINGVVASSYTRDGESPSQIKIFSHEGKHHLGVLYPDVDKLSVIVLPINGMIHTASRFGSLTDTGDYPQDLIAFEKFPLFNQTRLYVTGRNDNTLSLFNVDFSQPATSPLAISLVQKENHGSRPWDLIHAGGVGTRFYMTMHGDHSVFLMEGTR